MLLTSFINPYVIRSYSKLICMLIAPFDFRRCGVGLSTMSQMNTNGACLTQAVTLGTTNVCMVQWRRKATKTGS